MPPLRGSRHIFAQGHYDSDDNLYVSDRVPFRYQKMADSRRIVVSSDDTLWGLAAKYFASFPRPAGLWWVIGDFQPTPIVDPTIVLEAGAVLVIPSERMVRERIFDPTRSRTEDG